MWIAVKVLWCLGVIAGLALLYIALFLTEPEEESIQNRLEDWWLTIKERQEKSHSKLTVFMREIARLSSDGLELPLIKHVMKWDEDERTRHIGPTGNDETPLERLPKGQLVYLLIVLQL